MEVEGCSHIRGGIGGFYLMLFYYSKIKWLRSKSGQDIDVFPNLQPFSYPWNKIEQSKSGKTNKEMRKGKQKTKNKTIDKI